MFTALPPSPGTRAALGCLLVHALALTGCIIEPCADIERSLRIVSEDSGVSSTLRAVVIGPQYEALESIAVGDGGTVVVRGDTEQWSSRESGTSADLHAVALGFDGVVIAVGAHGTIVRSDDFGATWTPVPSPTSAALWDVVGPNADGRPWVIAGDSEILVGDEHAEHFTAVELPEGIGALQGLDVDPEGDLLAVGVGGTVLRSEGAADRWEVVASQGPVDLLDVVYWPAEDAPSPWLMLGADGMLYREPGGEPVTDHDIGGPVSALSSGAPRAFVGDDGQVHMISQGGPEDETHVLSAQIGGQVQWRAIEVAYRKGHGLAFAVGEGGAIARIEEERRPLCEDA